MTRIVSFRLPRSLAEVARADANRVGMYFSQALDFLVSSSLGIATILRGLEDSPEPFNCKIDVRLPEQTFEGLRAAALQAGIPIGVYIRVLFYNFYVSKKVWLEKAGDHYKLVARDD